MKKHNNSAKKSEWTPVNLLEALEAKARSN